MIKKSDFIAQVDYLRATNNTKKLKELEDSIVIGKSYRKYVLANPNVKPFYVLNICYNGFKAEQIFQDYLNDHNVSYQFQDWTQDYVIQYGDPKPSFDGSTLIDLVINNKRVDVKYKRLNPSFKLDDIHNWVHDHFINYKVEEITRKSIDYYVLLINFKLMLIIDCTKISKNCTDYKIVHEERL